MVNENIANIMLSHVDYVEDNRRSWQNHRDSYMDNFWKAKPGSAIDDVTSLDAIPLFAVNRMKGWVVSYTASLFYRGFSCELTPDELYEEGSPVAPKAALVKALIDRWFTNAPFDTTTEVAFTSCLLNPHGAFYLKEDLRPRRPIDRVTVEFMPAWECVWDRFSASIEECRYMGRSWWVAREDAQEQYGVTDEEADTHACVKPDVLADGLRAVSGRLNGDRNYVRLLDISFPKMFVKGKGGVRGKRCIYLLDASGTEVRELYEGPMAWQDADGLPLLNVEPIVLTAVPEFPLWGIPNAATIYALERENNSYAAWLAQAFKLEALRKLFFDHSKVTGEGAEKAMDGVDHAVVAVKPDALSQGAGGIAAWMAPAPSPSSGLQLRQYVESMFQAVQGTAPFTRGQPTQYIPATESANLSAYSETTLGLLRSKMDRAVVNLGAKYLRAMASILERESIKAVPVRKDDDIVPLPTEQLKLRWVLRIVDGANTPAKTEGQKKDALQLAPLLVQLAMSAMAQEAPPETRLAIQGIWDDIVKRFGLSEELRWSDIKEKAAKQADEAMPVDGAALPGLPPGAPPEPQGPPPVEPPNGLSPEQSAAIDSDAAAVAQLGG